MEIDDLLSNGMVRRWSLVDGQARCVEDALAPAVALAIAALQRNAAVRTLLSLVEPYEAAVALLAAGEPDNGQPKSISHDGDEAWVDNPEWALLPRMIETIDEHGQPQAAPEPRWQAYDEATAIVAGASAATEAMAYWRAGEPSEAAQALHAVWEAARNVALAEFERLAALPLEHDPREKPFTPDAVLAECRRRILAVASTNAQINMAAARAAGLLSGDQQAAFVDGLVWIGAMRAACAALVTAADATFARDAHWPACPANVAALAGAF